MVAAFVAALLMIARPCRAEPIRILVAVGHRLGVSGETPLKHAARDATRVRDIFVQLGGVRPENAILLLDPAASALFAALARVDAIARTHSPAEVTILLYFSGHGDRERIHLGSERVALRDIDTKLTAAPAALRIVVSDACRTADGRSKGAATVEPFAIALDVLGSGASGLVRLHASADGEVAQESDELGGALFTHYWLSGLAGAADVDADTRVTLAESYAFAYGQTLYRSARASGVVQRPAVQFDLRQAAPIVLTQITGTSAIVVPRATDAQYIVYGLGSRTVMGEVSGLPDRNVVLALPPGKYIVHRRGGGRSAAVQIDVGRLERRELRGADFQPVPEEVLARKGGDIELRPHELSLGYFASTSRLATIGHELSLRYAFTWNGGWALSVAAFGGFGYAAREEQEARVTSLGVDGLIEHRLRLGSVLLRGGLGPRIAAVLQTLRRADADRVALAGYATERSFRGTTAGAHALLGARIPLGTAPWLEVDARGELLRGDVEGSAVAIWAASLGASIGVSF